MSEERWTIPASWRWATAGDIAKIVGGGTPSSKVDGNFAENGIPWITPADLTGYRESYISRGRRDLSEQGFAGSGAQLIPAGSVLFSSRAPIGYLDAVDALRNNPWIYLRPLISYSSEDRKPVQIKRIKPGTEGRALSYIPKSAWFQKELKVGDKRSNGPKRAIPEPHHSELLLALHRLKLRDFILKRGLSVTATGFRVTRPYCVFFTTLKNGGLGPITNEKWGHMHQ